jgi:hypothetical protein
MLVNFLGDDLKFSKIATFHLFPQVYNNIKEKAANGKLQKDGNLSDRNLLTKIVSQCEDFHYSTWSLQKEQDLNKKFTYSSIEKWIILDSNLNDSLLIDQITMMKSQSNLYPSSTNEIPETVKFIIETPNLDNINPSIINRTLLIVQQDLDFKHVLETKISEICVRYNVPQSKYGRFFIIDIIL